MLFLYKAKNNKGDPVSGSIDSSDKQAAIRSLKEKDLFVVSLSEKSGSHDTMSKLFAKKVGLKDKIIFTKQLSIMIRSGLSILDALESLQEESSNKQLHAIILNLISEIQGGASLSQAMASHREVFGDIYISMIRSGEKSGKVDEVLERLAVQLEKDYDIIRKIKGALSYPIFILVTMVVVVALVIIVVIPPLKSIFDDAGVSLPALTKMMIALSYFLKDNGLYVLAGLVVVVVSIARWQKTKTGKHFFDKLVLMIPIINKLIVKSYMARFTRTFAALTASGLPLMDVFKSSSQVIGNVIYEEEIMKIGKKVENGELLSAVFKKSKLFPSMVGQLSAVGEKSGNVDEVFESMADFFERDVDTITSNLSSLLEPILMVLIGGGVGVIVVSVLQPIYSLVNAI